MRKFLMLVLIILSGVDTVQAWYTKCVNGSCVAEKGKLRVYYAEENPSDCMVTGVDGLPFTLSDLARAEKKSTMSMSKNFQRKKTSREDVSVSGPESGTPSTGVTGNREIAISKQKSLGVEKARTQQSGVDYTLAFVIWWAKKHPSWKIVATSACGQYFIAVEDLYNRYLDGSIEGVYYQWQEERRR
jgi:hypothetical protein